MSTNAQEPEKNQGTSGGDSPAENGAAQEILSEIEKLEAQFKEEKEKMTKDLQESNVRHSVIMYRLMVALVMCVMFLMLLSSVRCYCRT